MAVINPAADSSTVKGSDLTNRYGVTRGFVRFADITLGTDGDDTAEVPALLIGAEEVLWFIKGASVVLDAGEELDVYIQTTYDGTNWYDVRNLHWANADGALPAPAAVVGVTRSPNAVQSTVLEGEHAVTNFLDAAVADDTEVDLPLGIKTRARVKTTNAATGTLQLTCIVR